MLQHVSACTQQLKSFLSIPPPGKIGQALPANVNLLRNIKAFPDEVAFPAEFFTRMVMLRIRVRSRFRFRVRAKISIF